MELPNFEFKPWETSQLAPEEPLCAPAQSRFQVPGKWRRTVFVSRVVKSKWGMDSVYIKREGENTPVFRLIENPRASTEVWSQAYLKKEWWRFISFDSNLELVRTKREHQLYLSIEGSGNVQWNDKDFVGFRLQSYSHGLRRGNSISAFKIAKLLKKARANPTSDFCFALRWASLPSQERDRWIYEPSRGDFDECVRVLRWFVLSGNWWMQNEKMSWVLDVLPDGKRPYATKPQPFIDGFFHSFDDEKDIELPTSQRALLDVIGRYFDLNYNKECLRRLRMGLSRSADFTLELELPTQHERLEARLRLREWLQDKVSPDEIPALLGEA